MILQIIREEKCHVLFCEDKETGGHGARAFTQCRLEMEVNYIVEMDRRGDNDAVFYGCDNPDFTDFILSFGFEEKAGSFSDISVVAPYLEMAAVNISAGYYNEHRLHECIDMLALENNIRRIVQMVQTETEAFPCIRRKSSFHQFSLFEGAGKLLDLSASGECRQKLLMNLPDTARLISSGYAIAPKSTYLIDRESNVYIYLDELGAAVESEYAYSSVVAIALIIIFIHAYFPFFLQKILLSVRTKGYRNGRARKIGTFVFFHPLVCGSRF